MQNKWSQPDLAEAVNASRDIFFEMARKIADVFGITVDYFLGKNVFAKYNQNDIKFLEVIENLNSDTNSKFYFVMVTILRDDKARWTY